MSTSLVSIGKQDVAFFKFGVYCKISQKHVKAQIYITPYSKRIASRKIPFAITLSNSIRKKAKSRVSFTV